MAQVLATPTDQLLKLHGTGRIVLDEEPQHESIEKRGRLPHGVLSISKRPPRGAAEAVGELRSLPVGALSQKNQVPVQAFGDQLLTHRLRCVSSQPRQGIHLRQEGAGISVRTGATRLRSGAPGVDLLIQHVNAGCTTKHRKGPGG